MNYAIIAAGEGSRLKEEGFKSVKPLVRVNDEYLIERLIRIFKDNYAQNITIIINQQSQELQNLLNSKDYGVKINLIVKSTPSSLHSFYEIVSHSSFDECCLTTVDTIFNEREFSEYISYFKNHKNVDALMGTTEFVDDEKPLYIEVKEGLRITNFSDIKTPTTDRVSSGIYCFRKNSINLVDKAIQENISRMRNYQRMLVENHLNVYAYSFGKVIDIDHIDDIKKAESLIKNNNKHILAITRFAEYSPNSENKDFMIIKDVVDLLKKDGYDVRIKNEKDIDFEKDYCPYVISMARNPRVIECLEKWEKEGCIVINSTKSCRNCYREIQTKLLQKNDVKIPQSEVIIAKNEDFFDKTSTLFQDAFWLKRADFQTIEEIDVVKVNDLNKAKQVIKNYSLRGIDKAIISKNIEGDVIKFYGVRGEDFFYYYYPTEDKFHNKVNVGTNRNKLDEKRLRQQTIKAAQVLDLDIYGGDVIVDDKGDTYIIDMNDFPSFSLCRKQASMAIKQQFIKKCNL